MFDILNHLQFTVYILVWNSILQVSPWLAVFDERIRPVNRQTAVLSLWDTEIRQLSVWSPRTLWYYSTDISEDVALLTTNVPRRRKHWGPFTSRWTYTRVRGTALSYVSTVNSWRLQPTWTSTHSTLLPTVFRAFRGIGIDPARGNCYWFNRHRSN